MNDKKRFSESTILREKNYNITRKSLQKMRLTRENPEIKFHSNLEIITILGKVLLKFKQRH